jgi:hypothetical protein
VRTGDGSLISRFRRLATGATGMYVLSLAMSGVAVLVTVLLPPSGRGALVATTTSAAIAVAIGGLSLETFFLAQGRAWLDAHASLRSLAVYCATMPLAAGLGWAFAAYSAQASTAVAAVSAAALAAGNIPAAAGLSAGRFVSVYRIRALFTSAVPVVYGVLFLAGTKDAQVWVYAWLACQVLMGAVMWLRHGSLLRIRAGTEGFGGRAAKRMGATHTGVVAQIFTYRFEQLTLARYQGADALAVYSLAIAAMEFAQAGAVVSAQRVLGDHDEGAVHRLKRNVRRSLIFAAATGLAAVVGLALLGRMVEAYAGALLLGLLLFPRSILVVLGKILSARLVNQNGERTTAVIAVATSITAIVAYTLVVPAYGAVGAAVVSVLLFGLHTAVTAAALGDRHRSGRHRAVPSPPPALSSVEEVGERV